MIRLSPRLGACLLAALFAGAPTASFAGISVGVGVGIGVSVNLAPPPLPVYVQPPCIQPNAIWSPGYWAYGPYGYYWVPGTWVLAPQIGYLWTPGYWGFRGGAYGWHAGYWGPHVGFYGGVNYGFGYGGIGFSGGGWNGNQFRYNTAVTNVNRTIINNVYVNRTVVNNYTNNTFNRVSYNGGPGGVASMPTASEMAYRSEPHLPPTTIQSQHIQTAAQNRNFLASVNHGAPGHAAFATPLSTEHQPPDFVHATSADRVESAYGTTAPGAVNRRGVAASSAFSRFDRSSQTPNTQSVGAARTHGVETPSYAHTQYVEGAAHTQNFEGAARTQSGPDMGTRSHAASYAHTQGAYNARNASYSPSAHSMKNVSSYHAPRAYSGAGHSHQSSEKAARSSHAANEHSPGKHHHDN